MQRGHCTCVQVNSIDCGDHGTYNNVDCDCDCDAGWAGAECDSSLLGPDIRYVSYDLYLDSVTLLQADIYSNSPLIDFAMNSS